MSNPIAYVVRDVTGETQLSIRFSVLSHARQFADTCAMPVRVWRIVAKNVAPSIDLTPTSEELSVFNDGRPIEAIKAYRNRTGSALKDAKNALERVSGRHMGEP